MDAQTTGKAAASPSACASCATPPAQASSLDQASLFIEPEAGETPILQAVRSANTSLLLEVYLLTDSNVIRALEDAAGRGVNVQVMLELHPYGGSTVSQQRVLDELAAAGVHTRGGDPAFGYTHAKVLLVDDATAYIMTCNLTKSALGGSSYTANREYGIIDTQSEDVSTLKTIFKADWARGTTSASTTDLVISPTNSRAKLTALIATARTSLDVEDEEMVDAASEDALIAAVHRGVQVDVVLPPPSSGSAPSADVARLLAGGVHVRYISVPYMHAKLIVADNSLAFVGSENFSAESLDHNREVGVAINDPSVVSRLASTFALDWAAAAPAA